LRKNETTGLLFALCGFATLSLGDAVVKSMAGQWPPTAIAATRYALGAIGLAALLAVREGRAGFVLPHPRVQLLRGFAVALATVGFFTAIAFIPLAAATALTFTSPMITALLAALVLGEPARRETVIASVVAFGGVLAVLRPNFAAAGPAAFLPLLSALGMSLLMIGNRFVAGKASSLAMQFAVAVTATPLLLLAMAGGHLSGLPRFALAMPDWTVLARCALVACSASTAHWLIYMGTTRAGPATVAPMTYVQLLVATVCGWAFFGDRPDAMTMLGAAIIIGAGLFLWQAGRRRERQEQA
jgi:drug/metabolite transporter (DMT)-like permease